MKRQKGRIGNTQPEQRHGTDEAADPADKKLREAEERVREELHVLLELNNSPERLGIYPEDEKMLREAMSRLVLIELQKEPTVENASWLLEQTALASFESTDASFNGNSGMGDAGYMKRYEWWLNLLGRLQARDIEAEIAKNTEAGE